MDPFHEVEEDVWTQLHALDLILSGPVTDDSKLDFNNSHQEFVETLEDLKQAVHISEANPSQFLLLLEDIANRKQVLSKLASKGEEIRARWDATVQDPQRPRQVTTMDNRISQDNLDNPFADSERVSREFNHFQQQQELQNQDVQLDSLHQTMRNLNLQAQMMGEELEDQAYMLEDLDQEMDTVGNKLQRGLHRVRFVLENNKGGMSDWCIGILAFVLIILLILVIAI